MALTRDDGFPWIPRDGTGRNLSSIVTGITSGYLDSSGESIFRSYALQTDESGNYISNLAPSTTSATSATSATAVDTATIQRFIDTGSITSNTIRSSSIFSSNIVTASNIAPTRLTLTAAQVAEMMRESGIAERKIRDLTSDLGDKEFKVRFASALYSSLSVIPPQDVVRISGLDFEPIGTEKPPSELPPDDPQLSLF